MFAPDPDSGNRGKYLTGELADRLLGMVPHGSGEPVVEIDEPPPVELADGELPPPSLEPERVVKRRARRGSISRGGKKVRRDG